MNVAISRAQAHVVLLLSQGDFANPDLLRLRSIVEGKSHVASAKDLVTDAPKENIAPDILSHLLCEVERPRSLIGRWVSVAMIRGEVTAVNGDSIEIRCQETGELKKFKISVLKKKCDTIGLSHRLQDRYIPHDKRPRYPPG